MHFIRINIIISLLLVGVVIGVAILIIYKSYFFHRSATSVPSSLTAASSTISNLLTYRFKELSFRYSTSLKIKGESMDGHPILVVTMNKLRPGESLATIVIFKKSDFQQQAPIWFMKYFSEPRQQYMPLEYAKEIRKGEGDKQFVSWVYLDNGFDTPEEFIQVVDSMEVK